MRKSLICAIALALPGAASATNWVHVSTTDFGKAYIDSETIKRDGNTVTYWERIDKPDGTVYRAQIRIDCVARTWQPLFLNKRDANNRTLEHGEIDVGVRDIPPDSLIEDERATLCR